MVARMERRAFERHDGNALITCRYFNGGTPVEGQMVNYSEKGMCFISSTLFIEKSVVFVEIDMNHCEKAEAPNPCATRSSSVGEIKWCREIQNNPSPCFETGLAYYRF